MQWVELGSDLGGKLHFKSLGLGDGKWPDCQNSAASSPENTDGTKQLLKTSPSRRLTTCVAMAI